MPKPLSIHLNCFLNWTKNFSYSEFSISNSSANKNLHLEEAQNQKWVEIPEVSLK